MLIMHIEQCVVGTIGTHPYGGREPAECGRGGPFREGSCCCCYNFSYLIFFSGGHVKCENPLQMSRHVGIV